MSTTKPLKSAIQFTLDLGRPNYKGLSSFIDSVPFPLFIFATVDVTAARAAMTARNKRARSSGL
eukprot:1688363-Pleurochrysis_carterae.AAC.3